jgi:outer membrane protein OmpA-like peptidoglycan-associated protein
VTARMRLFLGAAIALALNAPGTSLAQQSAWWIAPGGGEVWIPNEYGVEPHRTMFGAILGKSLGPTTAIELRGIFATSETVPQGGGSLDLFHGSANFTWFMFDGAIRPYLTGGAGVASLSGPPAENLNSAGGGNDGSRFAMNGGFGLHIPFSDNIGLRIDGREVIYKVYVPSAAEEKYKHGPEAFAGLSFGFGGAGKDADQDGVKDKADKCPGTPFGARVDATGCPIDTDQDGVPDGIDACDGTPSGATVDPRGCPGDEDDDGVLNGIDQCAGTPKGARVNATGCPTDSDGDTVPDGIDECDRTPAGCTVSPNGCPTDQDQDGICDGVDKCPDTPVNVRVDATGCPISVSSKETELLETGMIRLQNVNFDTGKATIKAESFPTLNEVGDILGRWPQLHIEIAGHTDSRGTDAVNRKLSDARANSVRDYMLTKFPELKPDQFTAKGYGESQPISTNTTALGRAKNRRVEFRVLNKETLRKESEKRGFAPKE